MELLGETYYRIEHYDRMPPFFMSLVSSSDHWLFISSTGGLTAGRVDAESALFPYETDDKIAAGSEWTGAKTVIHAQRDGRSQLWEPFSDRYAGLYRCERHLYKNVYGNKLIFEEINHDLQLTYRYAWRTGDRFGFIKSSWLENHGDAACRIALLDGLQNIMPYGATALADHLQQSAQRLQAQRTRRRDRPGHLCLERHPDRPRRAQRVAARPPWPGRPVWMPWAICSPATSSMHSAAACPSLPETDVRGRPGAYLINAELELGPGETRHWHIAADVNQDSRDVANLVHLLGTRRRADGTSA